MPLKVAIQMDAIENIDINADSTFVLALEAQSRGYDMYYYQAPDLSLENGALTAPLQTLEVRREQGNHFTLGSPQNTDLSTMDVILMRQDPPFDIAYITATHLLEHVMDTTLVMNDPVSVRNAPEKLLVTHFSDLMPPTLISRDVKRIKAFRDEHEDIIIKPLHGNGGAEVFRVRPDGDNFNVLLEVLFEKYREPLMIQAFLPAVASGDKRIILIDGEPAGAVMRVPADDEIRANLHAGGSGAKTELTPRDLEICARLAPTLQEENLTFTGIDVIGDYLTEINVTSPTCLQEINALNDLEGGERLEAKMWDAFERKLKELREGE